MSETRASYEAEASAKHLNAPRITPADVEDAIKSAHFINAYEAEYHNPEGMAVDELKLLTICVLVLHNGFTVTGESACASPENYNRELGERIARDKAKEKIWPLLGYALRQRIYDHAVPRVGHGG